MTYSIRSRWLAVVTTAFASTAVAGEEKVDGEWRGTAGAALSITSGNTDSSALSLNADGARLTIEDKIALGAFANYGRSKVNGVSTTSAKKWAASGQYDYNLAPHVVVFGRLGLEGDALIDLDLRSAVSAGLGYKLIDTRDTKLTLYGGLGYTNERYRTVQTIEGETGTRFSHPSMYLAEDSSHQLTSTVTFKQRLDWYPGLSGDRAQLVKFAAGLSVAMSSMLNLSVRLVDTFNSKPAAGLKKNDVSFFTGVSVKFGAPS
jgi:putative salt-induced outer membrane protein